MWDSATTAGSVKVEGDYGSLQWIQVVSGSPLHLYIPISRSTLISSPPFSADPSQQQQLGSLVLLTVRLQHFGWMNCVLFAGTEAMYCFFIIKFQFGVQVKCNSNCRGDF